MPEADPLTQPEPSPRATDGRRALLLDWGGVMTASPFASFAAFCEGEGLAPDTLSRAFRDNPDAQQLLFALEEGRIATADFESRLAALLGVPMRPHLIERVFGGVVLDDAMVSAVRTARAAGIRTGLLSNSWGTGIYPQALLKELFDGTVISGEVGMRKPTPRIYSLGAEAIGRRPEQCVFVDDLPFNLKPARELGMLTVRHRSAEETIPELERLLGVALAG